MKNEIELLAFDQVKLIASGKKIDVLIQVKQYLQKNSKKMILIFDASNGRQVDFNLEGSIDALKERYDDSKTEGRVGRPKLGVISKEISLLPKHWDWLATRPGTPSLAVRKLIEDEMKRDGKGTTKRMTQDSIYRFMSAIGGDLENFEEATRVLYKMELDNFKKLTKSWPSDIVTVLKQWCQKLE